MRQPAAASEQDEVAKLVSTCEQLRAELESVLGQIAEIRKQAERSLALANDFELRMSDEHARAEADAAHVAPNVGLKGEE